MSTHAFPAPWVERMKSILPVEEHDAFFEMMARPLRKSIRVNTLKVSVDAFHTLARELGWELTPVPWCETGFWIDRESHAVPLGKSWPYAAGLFYIQEAASMLPPALLAAEPEQLVADMAAAPGSKTTQLAADLQNSGMIVANEPAVPRMKALSHNLELMGAGNVLLVRKDGRALPKYFPNTFDKILLDAPCTGEGTARKDRFALAKWNLERIRQMADLQFALAVAGFHALRAGGEMVYSTCTLAPEENESVVDRLLAHFGDAIDLIPADGANGLTTFEGQTYDPRVAGCRRLWPQREDCEGFFAAKLRKLADTETAIAPAQARDARSPFALIPERRTKELVRQLETWFGCSVDLPTSYGLWQRDDEVWLRPGGIEGYARRINFDRTGTRIIKLNREGKIIRLSHLGASMLVAAATAHVVTLDDTQRDTYLGGRDVPGVSGDDEGQVVVRYRGYYLGLGLLRDGELKNQLPREFIIAG